MLINNAKFLVKSVITASQAESSSFKISEDIETGVHLDTGGQHVSIVLQNTSGLERLIVSMQGGIATILKRGLGKMESKEEIRDYQRQWMPGTVGYITVLASDMLDIDNAGGKAVIETDISFSGATEFNGKSNFKKLSIPTFGNEAERDKVYSEPTVGDKCFIEGVGEQVYSGSLWKTLDEGTPVSNATKEIIGSVQMARDEDISLRNDVGSSGAMLAVSPSQIGIKYLGTQNITFNEQVSGMKILSYDIPENTNLVCFRVSLGLEQKELFFFREGFTDTYIKDGTNSNVVSFRLESNSLIFTLSGSGFFGFVGSFYFYHI